MLRFLSLPVCLALIAGAHPAHAIYVERDVSCAKMEITPEMFLEWRSVEHVLEENEIAKAEAEEAVSAKKKAPWEREREEKRKAQETTQDTKTLLEKFTTIETSVFFDTALPADAIVDAKYHIVLEWERMNPTRRHIEGEATFYGSDTPPLEISVQHQDFYHVIDAQVTSLHCHRIHEEQPEDEIDPAEAIIEQLR